MKLCTYKYVQWTASNHAKPQAFSGIWVNNDKICIMYTYISSAQCSVQLKDLSFFLHRGKNCSFHFLNIHIMFLLYVLYKQNRKQFYFYTNQKLLSKYGIWKRSPTVERPLLWIKLSLKARLLKSFFTQPYRSRAMAWIRGWNVWVLNCTRTWASRIRICLSSVLLVNIMLYSSLFCASSGRDRKPIDLFIV